MATPASTSEKRTQTINLAAGPSALPDPVLAEASAGLMDYDNSGIGVTELSHRSKQFMGLAKESEANFRQLLDIPDSYAVLWMQGGGLTQFSATAQNLEATYRVKHSYNKPQVPASYIVTGGWTSKAVAEAKRLGLDASTAYDAKKASPDGKSYGHIPASVDQCSYPSASEDKPAYIYYCSNETVHGVEMGPPPVPEHLKDVPLVADMSSNILSKPIPWDQGNFGIIFAGAQKNIGPSGVTLVVVRKDLIVDLDEAVPLNGPRVSAMMSYKNLADNDSLYNTPPMFSIYVAGLVFQHLIALGGVKEVERVNKQKAELIYNLIGESNGFYIAKAQPNCRSRMNLVFVLKGGEEQEAAFVKEADAAGIKQVKGHRSVGGIRTSLYNSITLEQTQKLAEFMRAFQQRHQ